VDVAAFSLIEDVVAPEDTQPPGAHVVDFEIQKLLSRGWQQYVALVRDAAGDDHGVAVRKITTSFESECHGGDRLVRGVRALHRTRRSYVLEEALWDATTARLVATSWVVMASVDPETGRAAPIRAALWEAVESFEGHPVETLEGSSTPA
jgi:acyl-CoA thioesterase FadM